MPQDGQAQADEGGIRGREPVRVQDCRPDSMPLSPLQEMQASKR